MPGAGDSRVVPMTVGISRTCGGLKGTHRAVTRYCGLGAYHLSPRKPVRAGGARVLDTQDKTVGAFEHDQREVRARQ